VDRSHSTKNIKVALQNLVFLFDSDVSLTPIVKTNNKKGSLEMQECAGGKSIDSRFSKLMQRLLNLFNNSIDKMIKEGFTVRKSPTWCRVLPLVLPTEGSIHFMLYCH